MIEPSELSSVNRLIIPFVFMSGRNKDFDDPHHQLAQRVFRFAEATLNKYDYWKFCKAWVEGHPGSDKMAQDIFNRMEGVHAK